MSEVGQPFQADPIKCWVEFADSGQAGKTDLRRLVIQPLRPGCHGERKLARRSLVNGESDCGRGLARQQVSRREKGLT